MVTIPSELYEDDSDEDLVKGLKYYEAKEWEKSLSPLEASAIKGNLTAIFKLANSLSNLDREDEALPLWEIAAEWGHTGACNNYAIRLNAVGDTEGARDLYRRAAAAGNAQSMMNLALTYDEDTETELYLEWLNKAAHSGMLRAQALIGNHLHSHGQEEEGLKVLENAIAKKSLSAHILAANIALKNQDYERSYRLADDALALPVVEDDQHLIRNAYLIRGVTGDHLGNTEQAIIDVKTAKDMGFDVSSAPLHLRVPKKQQRLRAQPSSQAALHYHSQPK